MTRGALLLTLLLVAAPAAAQDVERARTTLNNPTVFGTIWFGPARAKVSSPADGFFLVTNSAATLGATLKVDALATGTFGGGTGFVTAGSTATSGSATITATSGGASIVFNGTAFTSLPSCAISYYGGETLTTRFTALAATGFTFNTQGASMVTGNMFFWVCVGLKQ